MRKSNLAIGIALLVAISSTAFSAPKYTKQVMNPHTGKLDMTLDGDAIFTGISGAKNPEVIKLKNIEGVQCYIYIDALFNIGTLCDGTIPPTSLAILWGDGAINWNDGTEIQWGE